MLTTDKKARKEQPMARGLLDYFPDALAYVAHVSYVGNQQHNPGEPLHWARDKSNDHADCVIRHTADRGRLDDDKLKHTGKLAWRALALLQEEIEADKGYQATADAHGPPKMKGVSIEYTETMNGTDYARAHNFEHVKALGCLPHVAKQIVGGLTYHEQPNVVDGYVYVAGPMRGYPEFNFPAFDDARDRFLRNGWIVISPADIDRSDGIKEKEHKDGNADGFDQRVFVYRDFYALYLIAHTEGGAIAMLPGWEKSTGAVAEFFLARWLGLKILDATTGSSLFNSRVDVPALINSLRTFLIEQFKRSE